MDAKQERRLWRFNRDIDKALDRLLTDDERGMISKVTLVAALGFLAQHQAVISATMMELESKRKGAPCE